MGTAKLQQKGIIHLLPLLVIAGVIFAVLSFGRNNEGSVKALERSGEDRPDDFTGQQVHVMYVLPSDGVDQNLDSNGSINTSVAAFQKWFRNQTGGKGLKLDTHQGSLDVTFFRMGKTDEEIKAAGAYVSGEIEKAIIDAGLTQSDKIYSIYYGGGSTYACGGAAWPPTVPGISASMYLLACPEKSLTTSEDNPGYWEYAMLHDTLHVLGIVPECAPNHTLAGHVSDSSNDLMYAGPEGGAGWYPSLLDKNNDDYFRYEKSLSCPDLSDSPYVEAGAVPQPIPSPSPTPTPAPLPAEPTVSITFPTDGSIIAAGSTVTIKATASDDKGVTKVEFRVNSSRKCTVTSPSASGYLCDWKVVGGKKGTVYELEARAYDADGHETNSAIVTVTSQ